MDAPMFQTGTTPTSTWTAEFTASSHVPFRSLFHLPVNQNLVSRGAGYTVRSHCFQMLYLYYISDFRKQWPHFVKSCLHGTLKLFSFWETWSYKDSQAQVEGVFYKAGREKNLPSTPHIPPPDNQNLDSMAGGVRYVWIVTKKIRQTVR